MQIKYEKGYAIDKSVEVVVNSANGFLLLGKSGAGRIRDVSKSLTLFSFLRYNLLLLFLPKHIRKWFLRAYKKHNWKLSKTQLFCISLLLKNKGEPFLIGDAVLDKHKVDGKRIIHAIGMSYKISSKTKKIPATIQTVKSCINKSLYITSKLKVESIAIPVMCARKSFGLSPKKSLNIIKSSLKKYSNSSIKKVIICFDNKETIEYFIKTFKS